MTYTYFFEKRRILAISVAIPVKRVGYFSRARRTATPRIIVKIECDNGIEGIGETRGIQAASIINNKFKVLLKDKEITGPASMRLWCLPVLSRPIQALINHLKDDLIQ